MVFQQVKGDNNHRATAVLGQDGGMHDQRMIPTGRDATAREVALDGNLSFDQPQATNSTGRSSGNDLDKGN